MVPMVGYVAPEPVASSSPDSGSSLSSDHQKILEQVLLVVQLAAAAAAAARHWWGAPLAVVPSFVAALVVALEVVDGLELEAAHQTLADQRHCRHQNVPEK